MEVEPGMYRQQGSVRVTSFIELIGIRQQLFQSQLQYVPKITARKKCWNDTAIAKLGCICMILVRAGTRVGWHRHIALCVPVESGENALTAPLRPQVNTIDTRKAVVVAPTLSHAVSDEEVVENAKKKKNKKKKKKKRRCSF
jgi:hypothetical protein